MSEQSCTRGHQRTVFSWQGSKNSPLPLGKTWRQKAACISCCHGNRDSGDFWRKMISLGWESKMWAKINVSVKRAVWVSQYRTRFSVRRLIEQTCKLVSQTDIKSWDYHLKKKTSKTRKRNPGLCPIPVWESTHVSGLITGVTHIKINSDQLKPLNSNWHLG